MLIRLSRFIVKLFIISTTLTGNVTIGHDRKPKPGNNKTGESGVQNETSCSLCRYRRFSVEKPVLPNVKVKGIPKGGSKTMSMSEVEFPYSMQQQLDDHLLSINLDYPSSAGDDVDLDCESDITDIIFQKFPMSEYHWIFNSKPLEVDDDRMTIDGGLLSIEETQTSDSGIYVCKLEFSPGRRKTVAFFSVVVDSLTIDFHLDERKELKYRCPSSVFGLLYSKAFRTWELNGEVVEKMGKPSARNTSIEIFSPLFTSMSGRWTCVVHDGLTSRKWTAAGFNLEVDPAPPMKQQVEEFFAEYPVLCILAAATVVAFVLGLVALLFYRASANQKDTSKRDEENPLLQVIEQSEASETELQNKP